MYWDGLAIAIKPLQVKVHDLVKWTETNGNLGGGVSHLQFDCATACGTPVRPFDNDGASFNVSLFPVSVWAEHSPALSLGMNSPVFRTKIYRRNTNKCQNTERDQYAAINLWRRYVKYQTWQTLRMSIHGNTRSNTSEQPQLTPFYSFRHWFCH